MKLRGNWKYGAIRRSRRNQRMVMMRRFGIPARLIANWFGVTISTVNEAMRATLRQGTGEK